MKVWCARPLLSGLLVAAFVLVAAPVRAAHAPASAPPAPPASPPLPVPSVPAEPLLRDGDRVVFLGDSITAGCRYTRAVETFLRLRHPGLGLRFVNAGVASDTIPKAIARLERDVLAHAPTVVLVNFGMNDAGYEPSFESYRFEENLVALTERLKASGVRLVVWLDPTPMDARGFGKSHGKTRWAARIKDFVRFVHEEGARRGVPTVALHQPLVEAIAGLDPHVRPSPLLPDRVHPTDTAQMVMGAAVIEGLGFPVEAASLEAHVEADQLLVDRGLSAPVQVPWSAAAGAELPLDGMTRPVPLGFGQRPLEGRVAALLSSWRAWRLRVSGLDATASFRVGTDAATLGIFTGLQLSEGVDLLAAVPARVTPEPPDVDAQDAYCDRPEVPWPLADQYCAWDLVRSKDTLDLLARSDKLDELPSAFPDRTAALLELQRRWARETEVALPRRLAPVVARLHRLWIRPESIEPPPAPGASVAADLAPDTTHATVIRAPWPPCRVAPEP